MRQILVLIMVVQRTNTDRIADLEEEVRGLRLLNNIVPDLREGMDERIDDLDCKMWQAEGDIANMSRDFERDQHTIEMLCQEWVDDLSQRGED